MYISKMSRVQSKAFDQLQQVQHDRKKPKEAPRDPAWRHMQNIVDKAKRGEKL